MHGYLTSAHQFSTRSPVIEIADSHHHHAKSQFGYCIGVLSGVFITHTLRRSSRQIHVIDIELKDRLVAINRVTKVTKGGRTFSFSAIVVVGNEDGIIGWGLGKAGEVTAAIAKGVEAAKKNLTRVPVLKGTVPHEQSAKFGGAEVFIKPASTGTGVVAGGAMRAVLESVGVTDVLAKSKGSSNPHNLVKATILALGEMRDARMVAQNRGVSMEKVFRG